MRPAMAFIHLYVDTQLKFAIAHQLNENAYSANEGILLFFVRRIEALPKPFGDGFPFHLKHGFIESVVKPVLLGQDILKIRRLNLSS